ncbi:sulfite exporter TauE/SafE family protein [Daejeonella oryzae]|uniref:sulfite exporter TauE/SafE family protein n=1 Tax=Daejeonella oryzae TaxID=1122943 RepID=UPI0003FAC925|nr:sulfite exporter TauE/SafE family protein [Daejeonella oryzae]
MNKMATLIILIIIGILAGVLSGLIGIGGGIIVIPALVFILGYSQQTAQGTTLAMMVPPIGLLAAFAYYKEGYVDIKSSAIICIGFVIGSYFGAKYAAGIPEIQLRKIFSIILILVALKMFFSK